MGLVKLGTVAAFLAPFLAGTVLAACEPEKPEVAGSAVVAQGHAKRGQVWPILLQHCLRMPSCDPMNDFGEGAGQSSGVVGQTLWFAETKDVVKEGGQDYGARITLSFNGPALGGGKAGRPVTLDEIPSDLRAGRDRATWLSMEYRQPGELMEPYFVAIRSAQLVLRIPGLEAAKGQDDIANITSDYLVNLKWPAVTADQGTPPDDAPEDRMGAKLELSSRGKVVLTGYSIGIASGAYTKDKDAVKRGFEPWFFYVSRNLRDEPAPDLLAAIAREKLLGLKITDPDGDVMLEDSIPTQGFAAALEQGIAALADPAIKEPLTTRCSEYIGVENGMWDDVLKTNKASPAQRACDPRTVPQRMQTPVKADPARDEELRRKRDEAEKKAAAEAEASAPAASAQDR